MDKPYFSQEQINYIMSLALSAYKHNKLPKSGLNNYMLSFSTYLQKTGTIENVCPLCLGTGKKQDMEV